MGSHGAWMNLVRIAPAARRVGGAMRLIHIYTATPHAHCWEGLVGWRWEHPIVELEQQDAPNGVIYALLGERSVGHRVADDGLGLGCRIE